MLLEDNVEDLGIKKEEGQNSFSAVDNEKKADDKKSDGSDSSVSYYDEEEGEDKIKKPKNEPK
jgi:hypothetical protein